MEQKKGLAAMLVSKMGKSSGDEEESAPDMSDSAAMAKDLVDAIKGEDYQGVVDALKSLVESLEESEEPSESPEDESKEG